MPETEKSRAQIEEEEDAYDPHPLSVGFHVMLERGHALVDTEAGRRPEGPGVRGRRHAELVAALQECARTIDPAARAVQQPERSDKYGMFPEYWVIVWSGLTDPDDIWMLRAHLVEADHWVSEVSLHFDPATA